MSNKILVTGGTGYIGSHTVVELLDLGHDVIVVDDLSNSKKEVLSGIEKITDIRVKFYQIDISEKESLRQVFLIDKPDAIIHFAASKAVGESVENPLLYYRNNLLGLINLLDVMIEFDVTSVIFSSSCTVYGQPKALPVTEKSEVLPALSPYGNTKQIGEEIIRDVIKTTAGLQGILLRYFNPIGAHESGFIGELPQGVPNNLVPYMMKVATGEQEKLYVFGQDYNTTDGTCIRDYIHVVDLAKAHTIAVKRLLEKKNEQACEVFNLGTGTGYSVLDLIRTFENITGMPLNFEVTERREGDVEKIYADPSFANSDLGWKAELDLENMLESAWNWQKRL